MAYILAIKEEVKARIEELFKVSSGPDLIHLKALMGRALSDEDRKARRGLIWLFYNEGKLTNKEMAVMLGISAGRVRNLACVMERRIASAENKRITPLGPPYEGQTYTTQHHNEGEANGEQLPTVLRSTETE